MRELVPIVITSIASVLASSGLWAFLQRRSTSKDAASRLLLGLAYDKIASLGMHYIERGWISRDEYEEYRKNLYEPYAECGGNGTAVRVMEEVSRLPFKNHPRYVEIAQNGRTDRENA